MDTIDNLYKSLIQGFIPPFPNLRALPLPCQVLVREKVRR